MKSTNTTTIGRGGLRASLLTGVAASAFVPQFGNARDPYVYALPDTGGGYKPGDVYFANDGRFLETYFSEPQTNYAVGWRDPNNIQQTLDFIAPPVVVGRRFEWKKTTNAEEFLSELVDDSRAIGADFKGVKYTQSDVTDKTLNRGLTYIADLDNVNADDPNWQNNKVGKLLRRLYRNELRRAFGVLKTAGTNTNVTWDTTVGKNPDQDVKTGLLTATTATGIRPNRVVYGDSAWNKRGLSYEGQSGTSTAFGMIANYTPERLKERLEVDSVMVSRERYQTSANAKSEVLGSFILAFYAEDGVDTEDPSNVKRFVSSFSKEQGGGMVRVFIQQISAKLVAITVEHYSKTIITTSPGIMLWTVS